MSGRTSKTVAGENSPAAASAAALWLVLMKSYRSMQAYVEGTLAGLDIGLSDFMILEGLLHKGAMSMSLLGEKVMLANPSMTAAIARLERLGYVTREKREGDRRVRTVALTAAGRAFIRTVYAQHQLDLESVMDGISPGERAKARAVLKCVGLAAQAKAGAVLRGDAGRRPARQR